MIKMAVGGMVAGSILLLLLYAMLSEGHSSRAVHPFFGSKRFMIVAHRGGVQLGPENTLYSFAQAVKARADVLEMDVRLSRDGRLIVLHDPTVERTTNGQGAAENLTLTELQALDAAHHWSPDQGRTFPLQAEGIRIPELTEVFRAFPKMRMNIEIKPDAPHLPKRLCEAIRAHHMQEQVLVASFHDRMITQFRSVCPEVATAAGKSEVLRLLILSKIRLSALWRLKAQAVEIPEYAGRQLVASQRLVDAAHRQNLKVYVWTVNSVEQLERLAKRGIDGVITDTPLQMRLWLEKRSDPNRTAQY